MRRRGGVCAGELERILGDDSDQTCAVEYRTNFQSRSFEEASGGACGTSCGRIQFLQSCRGEGYARVCAAGAASGG